MIGSCDDRLLAAIFDKVDSQVVSACGMNIAIHVYSTGYAFGPVPRYVILNSGIFGNSRLIHFINLE